MSWRSNTALKDAAVCLSLANLYFLRVWRTLLNPERQFHLKVLPAPFDFVVLFMNIVILSALMYACLSVARRWVNERTTSTIASVYLLLACFLISKAYDLELIWPNRFRVFLVSVLLFSALVVWKRPRMAQQAVRFVGLALFPCLLVTTMRSMESVVVRSVQSESTLSAPSRAGDHRDRTARTALIIFDMLDYDLVFDHRMPDLQLPEFDRLRAESYFAHDVTSPNQWTQAAIPAITTGKLVTSAVPVSTSDLLLVLKDSSKVRWKEQQTIFSEARNAGMNVGLVGWYHPYCRLFGHVLSSCDWVGVPSKFDDRVLTAAGIEQAVLEILVDELVGPAHPKIVEDMLGIQANQRRRYIETYRHLLESAARVLTDPTLDLVTIHMPVPHTPAIYDRALQEFTLSGGDYLDNVALADRTLGILRRRMEDASLWKDTNILITADHGFRAKGPSEWHHEPTPLHVPFFLKMAGEPQHIEDDCSFNTTVIHDLVLALLKQEIANTEQAKEWLDHHQQYE